MTKLQVTTPEALPEETGADAALRPSRLDEFIGQAQVKSSLQIAIDAAKGRRETVSRSSDEATAVFAPAPVSSPARWTSLGTEAV